MVVGGRLAQETGEDFDHPVAAGVAETVVDGLEVVDIGDHQGNRYAPAHGVAQRQLRMLGEAATVEQAGKRIGLGSRRHLGEDVADKDHQDHQRQRQREDGAERLGDQGVGAFQVGLRIGTPAAHDMGNEGLAEELQGAGRQHAHQKIVERAAPLPR